MSTAKEVAQEYKLFQTQVPDLRLFAECEDETGRPYWVSNKVYKTREGALRFLDQVVRRHPRRKVVYRVVVRNEGYFFGTTTRSAAEYRVRADFVAK